MRNLSEVPDFVSHRYSDFPFLFTPYIWALLRSWLPAATQVPRERMHKDGIMITGDSPEGMEEVLWMTFSAAFMIRTSATSLMRTLSEPDFEAFLRDHIRKLILARGGSAI